MRSRGREGQSGRKGLQHLHGPSRRRRERPMSGRTSSDRNWFAPRQRSSSQRGLPLDRRHSPQHEEIAFVSKSTKRSATELARSTFRRGVGGWGVGGPPIE